MTKITLTPNYCEKYKSIGKLPIVTISKTNICISPAAAQILAVHNGDFFSIDQEGNKFKIYPSKDGFKFGKNNNNFVSGQNGIFQYLSRYFKKLGHITSIKFKVGEHMQGGHELIHDGFNVKIPKTPKTHE